jgi:hypothetical protein
VVTGAARRGVAGGSVKAGMSASLASGPDYGAGRPPPGRPPPGRPPPGRPPGYPPWSGAHLVAWAFIGEYPLQRIPPRDAASLAFWIGWRLSAVDIHP